MPDLPEVRHTLAIVPHFADQTAPHLRSLASRYPEEIVLVNVRAEPLKVIELIAASQYVLSSSLYGLIVADALGRPNRWLLLSRLVGGGGFKFRDYFSAYEGPAGNRRHKPLLIDGSESLGEVLAQIPAAEAQARHRGEMLWELFCGLRE